MALSIQPVIFTDGTQEFIHFSDTSLVPAKVNVQQYHTKIFSSASDRSITLDLGPGSCRGHLKLITYCKQEDSSSTVTISPRKMFMGTQIVLEHEGDQVEMMWTGMVWVVIRSLNILNLEIGPTVN